MSYMTQGDDFRLSVCPSVHTSVRRSPQEAERGASEGLRYPQKGLRVVQRASEGFRGPQEAFKGISLSEDGRTDVRKLRPVSSRAITTRQSNRQTDKFKDRQTKRQRQRQAGIEIPNEEAEK